MEREITIQEVLDVANAYIDALSTLCNAHCGGTQEYKNAALLGVENSGRNWRRLQGILEQEKLKKKA